MTARSWHSVTALGNTFRDLKGHAPTSLFTAAILLSPLLITSTFVGVTGNPFVQFVNALVGFLAGIWLAFAMTLATKMYATGEDPGVGGLLDRSGTRRLLSFMGTNLLVGLLIGAVVAVVVIVMAGASFVALGSPLVNGELQRYESPGLFLFALLALIVGIILATALALFLYLRYGLAGPVNALEGQTPRMSLKRSKNITEGSRLDFFVLLLMLFGIYFVISIVLNGPAMILNFRATGFASTGVGANFGSGGPSPFFPNAFKPNILSPAGSVVAAISTYLTSIVGGVLSASTLTNFYLGIRGEEVIAGNSPGSWSPELSPSPPSGPVAPTWNPSSAQPPEPPRAEPPGSSAEHNSDTNGRQWSWGLSKKEGDE